MKKIISALLLLSLLLSLCACGNKPEVPDDPTTTTPPTNETETTKPTQPSQTLDIEESSYYKNNNWDSGVYFTDIKGTQCAAAGDEWPALETGDLFVDKLFMYGYNMRFDGEKWHKDETMNGWGVRIADKSLAHKAITYNTCKTINKAPIVSAAYLLSGVKLSPYVKSMIVPDTVTDVTGLLYRSRLSTNISIKLFGIPEKYENAFDVMPDVKKTINNVEMYYCSNTISLSVGGDFEMIMKIASESLYGQVQPLLTGPLLDP